MGTTTFQQLHRSLVVRTITCAAFIILTVFVFQSCETALTGTVYVATRPPSTPMAPTVDSQAVALIEQFYFPFNTSKPESGFEDLAFLKDIVGTARVVVLGAQTCGTKEFFEMKHRIVEYLVTEMGFNVIAMKAPWAECNLINDYVQTGRGNPASLLLGLNYWPWNTQEVLNMIEWTRRRNENAGVAQKVSFFGFDFRPPWLAMDSVTAYLRRADPQAAGDAAARYSLFRVNQDAPGTYSTASYDRQNTCRLAVWQVYDDLLQHQMEYEQKTSTSEFARALQGARIAVQAEDILSQRYLQGQMDGPYLKDNASWLMNQRGTGAKMVVWTDNRDLGTGPFNTSLCSELRVNYGKDFVDFLFTFYSGSVNAYPWDSKGQRVTGSVSSLKVGGPTTDSFEWIFGATGLNRFILDLRGDGFVTGPHGTFAYTGHKLRFIPESYDPNNSLGYFSTTVLEKLYDVVVYFKDTSPIAILY